MKYHKIYFNNCNSDTSFDNAVSSSVNIFRAKNWKQPELQKICYPVVRFIHSLDFLELYCKVFIHCYQIILIIFIFHLKASSLTYKNTDQFATPCQMQYFLSNANASNVFI